MLSFLLAVHFVLTIGIIGLILLQKHDSDGALGSSGGGAASGMFSVRGQANLLTRSTAVLMTIFVLNCLLMAKIAKHAPAQGSVIDRAAQEQMPVKNSTVPAKAPDATPAAPATPSTPAKTAPQPAKTAPNAPAKK
ncbi:MAG: preprotein translocase subunit SecG [Alphaproteobacteria bacterium]|nr:preprotein translocase subunit SecG [Alphaproteobacteria bacterium]